MPTRMLCLTLQPIYVNLLCRLVKICICGCVWSALSLSPPFICSLVPLCRLGLHSSIRWRSAWLSCTCGPPRAHSKSKVALITMFNLPRSLSLSIILSLALSVITHFVFTPSFHLTCIFFNNLTLSQHQFILSFHFLFSHQTLMLLMAVYCIIHDILYIVFIAFKLDR